MTALRFKPAPRPVAWMMGLFGAVAMVLPCGVCYLTIPLNDRLERHERKHWEQYQRLGTVRFLLTYAWFTLRYGYRDNPFEIEARRAE